MSFELMRRAALSADITDGSVGKPASFSTFGVGDAFDLFEAYVVDDRSCCIVGGDSDGVTARLFKSIDQAQTWLPLANPLVATQPVFGVDGSDDGSHLFISGAGAFYLSTNQGSNWTLATGINYVFPNDVIPRFSCDETGRYVSLVITRQISNTATVMNDHYISIDFGNTFVLQNIITSSGRQANVIKAAKGNQVFRYVGMNGTASNAGTILRSVDSGQSWISPTTPPNLSNGDEVYAIDCTPDGKTVYCGCRLGKMFKSNDFGDNWTQINAGQFDQNARCVGVTRDKKMVAFGEQGGEYSRSFNYGSQFTEANLAPFGLRGMSINSTDDMMIIACEGGNVLRSRTED